MGTNIIHLIQKKGQLKYNLFNKRRKPLEEIHILYEQSGNEFVDDFIRNTQINNNLEGDMMEFVPYGQFKNIKFIAKVESYEAT